MVFLLRSVIGLENLRRSLYQSDAKLKQITTSSPAFSCALGNLFIFYFIFSSRWLLKVVSFLLVAIVIALDLVLRHSIGKHS